MITLDLYYIGIKIFTATAQPNSPFLLTFSLSVEQRLIFIELHPSLLSLHQHLLSLFQLIQPVVLNSITFLIIGFCLRYVIVFFSSIYEWYRQYLFSYPFFFRFLVTLFVCFYNSTTPSSALDLNLGLAFPILILTSMSETNLNIFYDICSKR